MASCKKRSAEDELEQITTKKQALENSCSFRNCDFCAHGISVLMKYEMRKQGWKQRLVVAFNSLEKSNPSQDRWHSLATEIYPFLETHWNSLWNGMEKDKEEMWRKKVQDCLTHNKDMFESGVASLGKKGYWRMIDRESLTKKSQEMNKESSTSDSSTSSPKSDISSTDSKPISSILQEAAAILDDFEKRTKEKAAKKAQKEAQYLVPQIPPVRQPVVLPAELLSEYASQRARRLSKPISNFPENVQSTQLTPPSTATTPDAFNTEFKNFLSRSGIRRRSCDITHNKPNLPNISMMGL